MGGTRDQDWSLFLYELVLADYTSYAIRDKPDPHPPEFQERAKESEEGSLACKSRRRETLTQSRQLISRKGCLTPFSHYTETHDQTQS